MLLPLFDLQVVFFGGKGGVGKTTCSSAFALVASRRVPLVSADSANSTSDIFEQRIGSAEREIAPHLLTIEIDAARESGRYIASAKREIVRVFSPGVVCQAYRQIDVTAISPGLAGVALLDRHHRPRRRSRACLRFDRIRHGADRVHTLQLLRMPEAMETWLRPLVKHRRAPLEIDGTKADDTDDPVLAAFEPGHERLKMLRGRVLGRVRTSFALVTILERLAIEETARG